MSQLIVTNSDQIQELLSKVVADVIRHHIQGMIKESTSKQYLTKEELMQLTGWSSRTLQNLRDTNQISYIQHGYKILYPRSEIMQFLDDHKISPR